MFLNFKHPDNKKKINFKPIILMWITGFAVSFFIICAISYIFHDSADPSDWNPELKKLIPRKNITIRHRSEGWGNSKVGKYGLCGIEDLAAVKCPKVLIWGDSYAQGLQVNDQCKMAQVFTETWNAERGNRTELLAAAVAFGGTNVADYYFIMPYYQKIAGNPICNFIFLHSFGDISADVPGISNAVFSSKPEFNLKFNYPSPLLWKQDVIQYMSYTGMDFLWYLYKDAGSYELNFRLETFAEKDTHRKADPASKLFEVRKPDAKTIASWDFLLKKIKDVSVVPVVFVYCPELPLVEKGRIIVEDDNRDSVPAFKAICEKNKIDLIDMTTDFRSFYSSTRCFPRGFQNSTPYAGHINRYGHYLTAKAICNYMKDHIDALHPN